MCPIQRNDFINIHTILHTHSSEASDNYKSVVKLREITKLPHFVRRRGYGLAIPSHTCKLAIHICMYIRSNCMEMLLDLTTEVLFVMIGATWGTFLTHDALKYIASCNYFVWEPWKCLIEMRNRITLAKSVKSQKVPCLLMLLLSNRNALIKKRRNWKIIFGSVVTINEDVQWTMSDT